MSANAENIKTQVNATIRNNGIQAFHNMNLNRVLLQIIDLADSYGGGGGNGSTTVQLTSANFIPAADGSSGTRAIDCPLTTLAGKNIAVFFNENQKYIEQDAGEWTDLPGGGFRVLIPEFDATTFNYHFYAEVL